MVCSQIWLNLLDDDCYFWLHHRKWNRKKKQKTMVITKIENGFNVNVNMLTYGFNTYLVDDFFGDLKDEHSYPKKF